jgi:hypothetical protein
MSAFMLFRAQSSAYVWWWGHLSQGVGGVFLAVAVGAVVVGGTGAVYLLAVGLHAMSELLKYPVTLRPFHPDGCNGFAPFGDLLILLFFLSVTIAASICIALFGGYLDVASFVGTWCRFSKRRDPFLTTFSKPFPPLE